MLGGLISIVKTQHILKSYPSHKERSWEIVIYTEGKGTANVGEQVFAFEPNTIISTPPGYVYSDYSHNGYSNFSIYLDQPLVRTHKPCAYRDLSHKPFLNITKLIYNEFYLQHENWEVICNELLDVLQLYLVSWENRKRRNPILEKIQHLLIQNVHNPNFCIKDTIRSLHESPSSIHRMFKAATGSSPLQYLIDLRIREARNLLSISSMSVKEIAYKLGFNDPYYFSRLFKRKLRMSPTAFRESVQATNNPLAHDAK